MISSRRRLSFGALALLLLCACGRKAPVKPPEDAAPRTITDLRASNASDGVVLTWSRPKQYVDGTTLLDLGRFVIERAEDNDSGTFVVLTTLEVADRERFRQTRTFRYLDATPAIGSTHFYRVIASTVDGYTSAPSNTAAIRREPPPNDRANSPTPPAR